jgi:hypothetical protein
VWDTPPYPVLPSCRAIAGNSDELVDLQALVGYPSRKAASGYAIVTWNEPSFVFDILAEESGLAAECKDLAWNHLDLMFDFFCRRGFVVGLDKVAQGMGLEGKTAGISDAMVPCLWTEG